jgi:hypothetical protein
MKKKTLSGFLTAAALILVVSAPLSAQSIYLNAGIPFEFTVGSKTLPAGQYSVTSLSTPAVIRIRGTETNEAVLAMTGPAGGGVSSRDEAPRLVFHRYGNHYVLAQIWSGFAAGYELPMSRTERELAKTASASRIVIVAMRMGR